MNDMYTMLDKFFSMFPVKAAVGVLTVVLLDARTIIFLSFAWLIFIDCFTRWLAITHDHLVENHVEKPSLWQCFTHIPDARRAGLIRSEIMRQQGVDKLLLYILCALVAATCDLISKEMGNPMWLTNFVMGYMATTELLSVVENLSDAGVESMNRLITKLKGRL